MSSLEEQPLPAPLNMEETSADWALAWPLVEQ